MVPGFDNYLATILNTATIEDILQDALHNTVPHFTLCGESLSNQRSTGVNWLLN